MNRPILHYQVIQGEVSNLLTEATQVNYLKNLGTHQELASVVSVLQAATGQAGAVNSAQAAIYEGDPVEGFFMTVDGKAISGDFWKATFKDGDFVKVVGREYGSLFEAVAVVKPDERLIWMRPHCERGTHSQVKNLIKCSGYFVLIMCIFASLVAVSSDLPLWVIFVSFLLAAATILIVTVGMSWTDFMRFAGEMDAVAETLGLPDPTQTDLFDSTRRQRKAGKADLPFGVFYY